jgi:hypothetical protein
MVKGGCRVSLLERVRHWLGRPISQPIIKAAPLPAPHVQYPEILHWQEGDEIEADRFLFSFIRVTEDGWVYGQNLLDDHKFKEPLWMVMRDGINLSLKDREIDEGLTRSDEYMQLIAAFNDSFNELRERDKKLKLVS